jgi:thioredoxin reductase (NADPH)
MSSLEPGLVETPDNCGAFPKLSDEQIAALGEYGQRRPMRAGEVLIREGERTRDFFVILAGKVAVVQGYDTPEAHLIRVHGPGRFLDELSLLTGQPSFVTSVVCEPGEVLAVPVHGLRDLVARDARLGDLILQAYLIRRELLIGLGAGFRIVGSRFSPDTRRLREFAARNRLPHRWIDLEEDPGAEALLQQMGVAPEETPVVIWRGTHVLRNPGNAELARVIGLPAPKPPEDLCDLVVVGAGPAGLAAAVYGASEGLGTVVLDAVATGGQAGTSSRIENYLGFPTGISGAELADRAVIQAGKFGAAIRVPAEVTDLARRDGHYAVGLDDGTQIRTRTVVIATGARYRKLDVPRLEEFEGMSVYYAATLAEAQFCREQPVAIVGGGNSAGQATLYLAQQASTVRLLIRDGDLGKNMSRYLVDQIERHPRVEVLRYTEACELIGDDGELTGIVVEDNRTGERRTLVATLLFVFIGAQPCTSWLGGNLAVDHRGFILTGAEAVRPDPDDAASETGHPPDLLETSWPGVLAVGDVRSGSIKRVASAVGEGAMAVRLVHEHLARRDQRGHLS